MCFTYFLIDTADWNSRARLDLTLAIVDRGALTIDQYRWNTGDVAFSDGHYYSNKAPGQSFSGVPLYLVNKIAALAMGRGGIAAESARAAVPSGSLTYFDLLMRLEAVGTVSIPAVLLLLVFYLFLENYSGSVSSRLAVTLGLGLGTMFFPYAQVFYSHVPTAAFLFSGFAAVHGMPAMNRFRVRERPRWLQPGPLALIAGLLIGTAVLMEYTAVLPGAVMCAYAARCLPRRSLALFALGIAPPILLLAGYDTTVYHSPFATGYSAHSINFGPEESQGIAGLTWPPRIEAIVGMLISPARGLLLLSPWLLLSVAGLVVMAKSSHRDWGLLATICLPYLALIAMYWGWKGGNAIGPRYLLPVLPFWACPAVVALDAARRPLMRLCSYLRIAGSIGATWMLALGGTNASFPAGNVSDPLFAYSIPSLVHGPAPRSIGGLLLGPVLGTSLISSLLFLLAMLVVWSGLVISAFPLLVEL